MSNQIITISREYASGGREIGQKLAQRLGMAYFDRAQIIQTAKASGVAAELFEQQEEHTTNSLLYSLVMGTYVLGQKGLHGAPVPISDRVFSIQAQIIRDAAQKQPTVFVGRCADWVLAGEPRRVSFFLYADRDARIRRAMELYHLNAAEAADRVDRGNKTRSAYYNYYSPSKWGARENYDLMLNTTRLGLDGTTDLLGDYLRHAFGTGEPR